MLLNRISRCYLLMIKELICIFLYQFHFIKRKIFLLIHQQIIYFPA